MSKSEKDEIEEVYGLTGADVALVIAFLAFIVVWVGGWVWGLSQNIPDEPPSWWVSAIILFIIAGPAIWAGGMISHILGKDD